MDKYPGVRNENESKKTKVFTSKTKHKEKKEAVQPFQYSQICFAGEALRSMRTAQGPEMTDTCRCCCVRVSARAGGAEPKQLFVVVP